MPKVKSSLSCKLNNFVSEFGEEVFKVDDNVLFCQLCECKVNSEKKFNITQHLKTDKHIKATKRHQNKIEKKQQFLTSYQKNSFNVDLCKAFIAANIPLNKLSNPIFRQFLETYMKNPIPDQTTLRKLYVDNIYNETMENIRSKLSSKRIWVSIDETTDFEGRYIANVIVGSLEADRQGVVFLLHTEELGKTNFSSISQLFNKSMGILWPNGVQHEHVLLFVSDAAPYMVKAGTALQVFYSKMLHVTYAAHGLHRVAEQVRSHFSTVDKLIASVKQVFKKAPSRLQLFKNELPGVKLPQEPVITRWGTWLNAATYYCENIQAVRHIIGLLDQEDAISIQKAKKCLDNPNLENNLAYIKSNFSILSVTIDKLQAKNMSLATSLNIIENIEETLKTLNGEHGKHIYFKLKNVLEKNSGLSKLKHISNILDGEENTNIGELLGELTCSDIVYFKYAPIVSVDVERSFSTYKTLLADNRRKFKFDNLAKHLIIQCNTQDLQDSDQSD
ncbi:uncharacterized protein LOC107882682 [Acyrthosiphon pisum]|uniref:DUF659 domain-containing protein n=1 Tax=Acyrthosiphon pisum TaxID=7029 RepID=A0A8R2H3M7_ACYPI|nr:uncharacterized protein LOC107882682 [Acyrthosiphon pisum]